MKEKELERLVVELQNDKLVFEEIYYLTQQKLFLYAKSFMESENDAKDLLQETYIEIIKSVKNLQDPSKFIAWSKKILYHLAMQRFRRSETAVILDEDYKNLIDNFEDTDGSSLPEEAYDANEVKTILRELITGLPVAQRLSIIAYYYDEMPIQEIAEMMDCSENTVKTRLHYARLSLKNKLENYESKHDIKLHALTPLILLSLQDYDKVYAMSENSAQSLADKISDQLVHSENLTPPPSKITSRTVDTTAAMGAGKLAAGTAVDTAAKAIAGTAISKIIAIVAVIVVIVSGVGISHTVNGPEKTINNLEKSFNKGDLDGVLDCLDPETKLIYQGITGLASIAIGSDVESFLSSMFGLAAGVDHQGRISIDIVIKDIEANKADAVAEVYMVLYHGKEIYDSAFENLNLKKIDGKWYIME